MSAAVEARHLLHLAAAAPALVRLVQVGAGVLLVLQYLHRALRLVLEAHPLNSAAAAAVAVVAASASDAGAFAGSLQLLVTWSWGSFAADLAVLAHPVVLPAAAGDRLHLQTEVEKGVSLALPGQAA